MINKKRFAKLTTLSLFLLTTMAFADHPAAISTDLPTAMVMAAGRSFILKDKKALPLIASSINGGKTWEVRWIENLPPEFLISSQNIISSCTGTGNDAVCVATGYDMSRPRTAFIILSQDGTKTWNFIDLTDRLKDTDGLINGATSMGSGKTATIILTGVEGLARYSPLILVSTDGGTHWISKGSSLGIKTELGTISCTGEGKTALCMAIGNYYWPLDPLLAISTDGGNTWAFQRVSPSLTEITDINCINGNTCAALGYIEKSNLLTRRSIIKTTTDKGKNWKDTTITDGKLNSINCTGSGSATLCAAVGATTSGSVEHPFVTVSTDNGATWVSKPVKDSLPGRLTSVSCTQTKGSAVCAAVGYGKFIVISPDGGNTWQCIQKENSFQSVNCSPNGTGAYCAARAPAYTEFDKPILAVSSDLLNWKILKSEDYTGPIPLPTRGEFSSVASTTSLALPRKNDNFDRGL